MNFIKLFEPITISGLTIKNRIVMPAMDLGYTHDFALNDQIRGFYTERAKGGVGLMTVGPVAIDPDGVVPGMLGLYTDEQAEELGALLDDLHRKTDVKVSTQLMHMGRNAFPISGKQALAPSAVPGKMIKTIPREMTKDDIEMVKEQFAVAGLRAKQTGFDFVEIIGCTGYLISQFLSPLSNQRVDEYGGSYENRMRFGLEVIQKVREAVGPDFPIGIRIAGNDFMDGGSTNREAAVFSAAAEKAGVNAINVTGGWHETYIPQLTTNVPPGAFLYLARGVRQAVGIPVFASNRLGNPEVAERAIRSGACDMVCWGRPLIADPELPNKVKSGRLNEIIPCVACNQGCFDAMVSLGKVHCLMNPMVGMEHEITLKATQSPKDVIVAGGGPAGMSFAITAAKLGHRIRLYEQNDHLGGQLIQAKASPGKAEFANIIRSMENRMSIAGVEVHLNTRLDKKKIQEERPDVLVVATGATPMKLNIKGIEKSHVISAWEVLADNVWDIGNDVVIIGGSATGCETAHYVAALGVPDSDVINFLIYHRAEKADVIDSLLHHSDRTITIVDMLTRLAGNVGPTSRWSLMKSLKLSGVQLKPETVLKEITDDAVIVESGGKIETIPADTVILATGAVSENRLAKEVNNKSVKVITIGDAESPRNIKDAVREGFDAALKI